MSLCKAGLEIALTSSEVLSSMAGKESAPLCFLAPLIFVFL